MPLFLLFGDCVLVYCVWQDFPARTELVCIKKQKPYACIDTDQMMCDAPCDLKLNVKGSSWRRISLVEIKAQLMARIHLEVKF